jgi:hypothetical protein
VPDEISTGELGRRLDEITRLLQGLVGRSEYTEYQRHMEHRLAEQAADMEEKRRIHERDVDAFRVQLDAERRHREDADDAIKKQIAEEGKGRGANLRQGIYSGIVPGIFLLITLLVTVFLAFKGGK